MRASVDLLWIPLGSGQQVVRLSGRLYESVVASATHRPRRDLYHSALVVTDSSIRTVIELAPVADRDPIERGVVGAGPVGLRQLGRFRMFQYELRCWSGGSIPDEREARVRHHLEVTSDDVAELLGLVSHVPRPTWGRDEFHAGEMWNSNSVISWLLTTWGVDTVPLGPPPGGRAPGWDAGIAVARRPSVRDPSTAR